jgi:hypothetical protein
MSPYSYLILAAGTLLWVAPFLLAIHKGGSPLTIDKRARWGIVLAFSAQRANELQLDHVVDKLYRHIDDNGRRFRLEDLTTSGLRENTTLKWRGHSPSPGRSWRYDADRLEQFDAEGRIHFPNNKGLPRLKRYLDELPTSVR